MAKKAKNIVWANETQTNEYLTLLTRRALNKAHKNWETCTINDFDLDRVYLDLDGRGYTIRMWNIQDCGNKVQTTYTLYIDMWNKEEGYGYGVEIVYGRFLEKASLLYGEDDESSDDVEECVPIKLNYENACEELKKHFLDYCESVDIDVEWVNVAKEKSRSKKTKIRLDYTLKNDVRNGILDLPFSTYYEMIDSQYNDDIKYGFFKQCLWTCNHKQPKEIQEKLYKATDVIARKIINK